MKKKRDKAEEFKQAFKGQPTDGSFDGAKHWTEESLILIPISMVFPPMKLESPELPPNILFAFQRVKNLEVCNHKSENQLRIEFLKLIVEGHLFVNLLGQMFSPNTEAAKAAIRRLYVKKTD